MRTGVLPMPRTIGGGRINRHSTISGVKYSPGMTLTSDEILAIPVVNRKALIEVGILEVWPQAAGAAEIKRFVVSLGFGKFDVIEGRKLSAEPLTKAEAYALAELPMPADKDKAA